MSSPVPSDFHSCPQFANATGPSKVTTPRGEGRGKRCSASVKKRLSSGAIARAAFFGIPVRTGAMSMSLTKDFKETIQARAVRDAAFRKHLLQEAVDCMLAGDVDTGKIVLRDYVNATIGFDALAAATHKSPKSLMRMLGPRGNPQARNLFVVAAAELIGATKWPTAHDYNEA
jgi:hypothetical protein